MYAVRVVKVFKTSAHTEPEKQTVISGNCMPSSSHSSSSTTVVELAGFRGSEKSSSVTLSLSAPYKNGASKTQHAQMLSIRQHLSYQASVEIDKIDGIHAEFGEAGSSVLIKQIRKLLNKEFGQLRVNRDRGLFVIRHRSVEGLISSLLRVQFHAHQIELPVVNKAGEASNAKPVTLTWGVGRTNTEAEVERLRRRRQKFRR